MFGSVGSGIVKPDSQPPSRCSHPYSGDVRSQLPAARCSGRASCCCPACCRTRNKESGYPRPRGTSARSELHPVEAPAVYRCDGQPPVVGDHEPVGIGWIDPDIVVIAAPGHGAESLAAIERLVERAVGHQHFVLRRGRYGQADVVAGAADQRAIPVHHAPVIAAVIGSPQASPGPWSESARRRDSNSWGPPPRRSCPPGISEARVPSIRVHLAPPSCEHRLRCPDRR